MCKMDFPVYFRAEYNGDGIQRQWNASTNLLYINICTNTLKSRAEYCTLQANKKIHKPLGTNVNLRLELCNDVQYA